MRGCEARISTNGGPPDRRPKRARRAAGLGAKLRGMDANLRQLTTMPNVGPAIARRLLQLGFTSPAGLRGQDPGDLFLRCSALASGPEDPCLLDTLRAAVDAANGEPPRPWWHYSRERKSSRRTERSAAPVARP